MTLNNDIVISTTNLSKIYKLYNNPKDRLKESLHPRRKRYHREFYALRNINIQVRKGEVLGIVGQNGSGKSTLLKVLSKVLTPSKGDFSVKGKVTSLLELGSGFNPELTGIENVFFYATILGFDEEKIKEKLNEILDFADIGDFVYQPLKTYSSGMRARLAFAVAINVEPSILILDEILAVGDELFRRKCYARMEEFFKGGKTILLVSHSIPTINQLCNRAVMLDRGELILEGPAKLVTKHYERYLFSKKENMPQVRKEIIALNKNEELKAATYEEIERSKQKVKKPKNEEEMPVEFKEQNKEVQAQAAEIIKQKAYFIPGLKPKSTVEYRNEDVDITDVCILTPEGEKVNVLITGEKYIYSYKVKFNVEATNVVFGMKIKTEKGVDLSASNSKTFKSILNEVFIGNKLNIQWHFDCNLLAGTYYINAGVSQFQSGKYIFLNRIIDATVFKVQKLNNELSFGILNMNPMLNISLLD